MKRFMVGATLTAASAVTVLLAAMPAHAGKMVTVPVQAPLQILGADNFCSGWSPGTDSATGAPTLTCIPIAAGAPTGCTATVNGTISVTLANSGGSVNLSASCSNPATGVSYNWTRNGAASATSAAWTDTLPPNSSTTIASTTSYQVSACVGAACVTLPSSPLTAIVPPAPAPAGSPTGCTATINGTTSASLPSTGGSVNLAVSCTSPASGIAYSWLRNGASASNAANWTDTVPANVSTTSASTTNYQVQACVGSSCVTIPQTPLTATAAAAQNGGGGGGGTPWNGTCPGFDRTLLITMDWSRPVRMLTRDAGMFSVNGAVVVQFTTGSVSSTNSLPRLTAAEYSSAPSGRIAVLSETPCDFGTQPTPGATITGNSVTAIFAIGTGTGFGYYPVLKTNTTYYLNIKNAPGSTCMASGGPCDMFIDLVKVGGL